MCVSVCVCVFVFKKVVLLHFHLEVVPEVKDKVVYLPCIDWDASESST